jgi:2-hydroxy-3-oxopropionate reductase
MIRRIGFVGTGIMGKPLASRLLRAGYDVAVYNRTSARAAELVAQGARGATTPRDAADGCDAFITMLPEAPDVEGVLFGAGGAVAALRPGAVHIDMSTIAPAAARTIARRLAERGVDALDAPVSGGEVGAIAGTLAIMVGGGEAPFDRARPVLEAMSTNVVRVGGSGSGQVAKACNQLIVVATIEAVAEALALARALGADPGRVRDAMLAGFASSRILEVHGRRMIDADYGPGGRARLHLKDRDVVAEAAAAAHIELPVATAAFARIATLVEQGGGDLDQSALYTLFG